MRIEGRWLHFPNRVERPVIDSHLLLPGGQLVALPLVIDTGADFTVLAYAVAQQLEAYVQPAPLKQPAIGVGGMVLLQVLGVDLILTATSGQQARLSGPIPVLTQASSLEFSVLGRNALDLFDLVYSPQRQVITL